MKKRKTKSMTNYLFKSVSILIFSFLFLSLTPYNLSLSFADDIINLEAGTNFGITNDDQSTQYFLVEQASGEVGIGVSDAQGSFHIDSDDLQTDPVMVLENNAESMGFYVTDDDPATLGVTSNRGDVVINTTTGELHLHDGSAWRNPVQEVASSTFAIVKSTATIAGGGSTVVGHAADSDSTRNVEVFCGNPAVAGGYDQGDGKDPYDPEGYSTQDANINNGNLTDLWYNNSVTGSVGKWIGIDLGSEVEVDQFRIYDWNNTYICTAFDFDYSSNGVAWSQGRAVTGHTFSPNPTPATYNVTPSVTGRYFRIQSNTCNNATYWVVSELEIRGVATAAGPPTDKMTRDVVKSEKTNATSTTIYNLGVGARNCAISISDDF